MARPGAARPSLLRVSEQLGKMVLLSRAAQVACRALACSPPARTHLQAYACVCFVSAGPADDPGVNSRALAELFQVARERAAEVAYTLSASVLEIYQEQIFDLLTGSKDTGEPRTCGERTVGKSPVRQRLNSVSMHLAAAYHSCPHSDAAMADSTPGLPPPLLACLLQATACLSRRGPAACTSPTCA